MGEVPILQNNHGAEDMPVQEVHLHCDNDLGHPLLKLKLIMSSQRGYIITSKCPIFELGCNLSHFGLFVLGSTRFYIFFWVMGQNQRYELLYEDGQETYSETSYYQMRFGDKIKRKTIILLTKTD